VKGRPPLPLIDHFALIAPYYDRIFYRSSVEDLVRRLEPEIAHRVLDVGGGTGRVAQHLVGAVGQICVLDPSPGMLAEGQQKGICITQGEAEALPYASHLFDRIMMVDAFHHLRHQERAAAELMRVLVPGGRLVVEEPDIGHVAVQAVALGEKLLLMRSRFRQPRAMQHMFEVLGGRVRIDRRGHTAWIVVDKPY
jgi:demethylmenaquinone methyltransferase/2-methoxy-6-polyprenyl-1,4-benzoquinol methylase